MNTLLLNNRMSSLLPSGGFWDDIYDSMLDWGSLRTLSPRMKVTEDEKQFVLSAELPGFTSEDVDLSYENSILTLEAERKEEKKENVVFDERRLASFSREFLIENVDVDKAEAKMKNGILSIVLPKIKGAKSTKIKIS